MKLGNNWNERLVKECYLKKRLIVCLFGHDLMSYKICTINSRVNG